MRVPVLPVFLLVLLLAVPAAAEEILLGTAGNVTNNVTVQVGGAGFVHRAGPVLGIDLIGGTQSGVRAHLLMARNDVRGFAAEAFYGATATRFGTSEAAGFGGRWYYRRPSRDGERAVVLGPGVAFNYNFHDGNALFVAPTLDVGYERRLGEFLDFQIGVNAGLGVGLSGRDGRRFDAEQVGGRVTPLIGVYGGIRF